MQILNVRKRRQYLLLALCEQQNHHCAYCGKVTWSPLHYELNETIPQFDTRDKATLEHLEPQCNGGHDGESNCVMACLWCNNKRDTESYETFHARLLQAKALAGNDYERMYTEYERLLQLEKNIGKAIALFCWLMRLFPEVEEYYTSAVERCLLFYNINPGEFLG